MHHSLWIKCSLFFPVLFTWIACSLPTPAMAQSPTMRRTAQLTGKVKPRVKHTLQQKNLELGMPVFIRIFKDSGQLELWLQGEQKFKLFKTYPICNYSGYLGPKLYEGDWQSPEGLYTVSTEDMNPNSRFHLSFNIGYPNAFDLSRNRTGSNIMVHGGCSSRGCFAMGDHRIEEIYLFAQAALTKGQQQFSIHVFPFKLSAKNLAKFDHSPWIEFWKGLQPAYAAFERSRLVPEVMMKNGSYRIRENQHRMAITSTYSSLDKTKTITPDS